MVESSQYRKTFLHPYDLPLPLQDLCLLKVINDLDSYPVDLLASMPRWLRHRLLNNLPVLDLCRLDHTPVAKGVAIDEIWKSLMMPSIFYDESKPWIPPMATSETINTVNWLCVTRFYHRPHKPFLLEQHSKERVDEYITKPINIPGLDPEVAAAFQAVPERVHCGATVLKHGKIPMVNDAREMCLLKAAIHLLDRLKWMDNTSESYIKDYKVVFEWLVSMNDRDLLIRNLNCYDISDENEQLKDRYTNNKDKDQPEDKHNHQLWNTQTTALAKYQNINGEIQLVPHRLLPIHDREDLLELFSLLTQNCCLQPSEITINSMSLAKSVRRRFPDEERCKKFISLLKKFLQNIVVLGLWSGKTDVDMCRTVIEGVIGNGKNCRLQVLYCREHKCVTSVIESLSPSLFTLPCDPGPPWYQGLSALEYFSPVSLSESMPYLSALLQQQVSLKVVSLHFSSQDNNPLEIHQLFNTLGSLFSRQLFQALSIKMDGCIETRSSLLLLKSFILAPCPHVQQLTYDMECETTSTSQAQSEISTSEIASLDIGSEAVPQCGIQHKTLLTFTHDVCNHLLYFPTIRLKDLNIWDAESQLHAIATHPDLQVNKLRLDLRQFLPDTACDDMRTLLKMPTLTKLIVIGDWTQVVTSALAQGLVEQAKVGSIHAISLCTDCLSHVLCSKYEFQELWDALFSLPQLEDLELVISGDKLLQVVNYYEHIVYESWKSSASGRQLKLIEYIGSKVIGNYDFTVLGRITRSSYIHLCDRVDIT